MWGTDAVSGITDCCVSPSCRRNSIVKLGWRRNPEFQPRRSEFMAQFLNRLGRLAVRRKWLFVGVWLIAAVAAVGASHAADGHQTDVYTIPGAESQTALGLLTSKFPAQAGDTATV